MLGGGDKERLFLVCLPRKQWKNQVTEHWNDVSSFWLSVKNSILYAKDIFCPRNFLTCCGSRKQKENERKQNAKSHWPYNMETAREVENKLARDWLEEAKRTKQPWICSSSSSETLIVLCTDVEMETLSLFVYWSVDRRQYKTEVIKSTALSFRWILLRLNWILSRFLRPGVSPFRA